MAFDAILFDCVLVDSEPITHGVLRDMLEESGWSWTPAEWMVLFYAPRNRERVQIGANTDCSVVNTLCRVVG
jgi:beta-phosphoglucomutase-like phosphatase (HAD superfamily)